MPTQTIGRMPRKPLAPPEQNVAEARTMVVAEGRADLVELGARDVAAEQAGQDDVALFVAALRDEIARAFRDEDTSATRKIAAGMACIRYIQRHASSPSQKWAVDTPARRGQEIIDQERGGQAGDDHDLLDRRHPAANARRRDLGNVGRRKHARRADRHAAADSRDDEDACGSWRQPWTSAPIRNSTAASIITLRRPIHVGEAAGEEGADEAADQQRCDGEAEAVAR